MWDIESNWIESVWLFHFSTILNFCIIIGYTKDWNMLAKSMWVVLMNVEESQSMNGSQINQSMKDGAGFRTNKVNIHYTMIIERNEMECSV